MANSSRWSGVWLISAAVLVSIGCNKSENRDEPASVDSTGEAVKGGEHKPHEVPQAALDACQGKAVGDACTVQFHDKSIDAKCAAGSDGRIACLPPRGEHKKPEGS